MGPEPFAGRLYRAGSQIANVVHFHAEHDGKAIGAHYALEVGGGQRNLHEVVMPAHEGAQFLQLQVGGAAIIQRQIVCPEVRKALHRGTQHFVVDGQCHHDPQAAVIGAADPVDPHFLVRDVIPDWPIGKVRSAARVGGWIGRAELGLQVADDQFADRIATCVSDQLECSAAVVQQNRSAMD